MTLKQLSLGDLTFANIIDRNYLYVDKTRYIYELLQLPERQIFLSRPRRFGKTLLLRTIKELFAGQKKSRKSRKSLFEGLWIKGPESDYQFPKHPVLSFNLSMKSSSPEALETDILGKLEDVADKADLTIKTGSYVAYFRRLIQALAEKDGSPVVVLIDEYDAPVTRNMDNPGLAEANAKVLHDLFATLKEDDVSAAIHLAVVTGITRYALTSMDSGATTSRTSRSIPSSRASAASPSRSSTPFSGIACPGPWRPSRSAAKWSRRRAPRI
jgi:hypothetical protein